MRPRTSTFPANTAAPALFRLSRVTLAVMVGLPLGVAAPLALAQIAPDAGRVLQQQMPAPQAPPPSPGIAVQAPPPAELARPGGAQITVQSISIHGNSLKSSGELQAVLSDAVGKSFDFAGLRALAGRISAHYRAAGYPFARAFLPPQSMDAGVLRIDVMEGRYGKVSAVGDDAALAGAAQAFLAPLQPGAVIESTSLERTVNILSEQPGIRVAPVIRPGQETGTGDLDVRVDRGSRVSGEAGADNHGNRYVGRNRMRLNLNVDSPFTFGDQVTVRALLTDEGMWLGSLGYSLPLGVSGLRGNVSYTHAYYELADIFAASQATGTADVASLGLSYPLLRTQRANVSMSGSLQDKKLNDRNGLAGTSQDKSSSTLPLALNFDMRDGLGGGGMTYGMLAWTPGRLRLDNALLAGDQVSAQSAGSFSKINLDLARIQAVSKSFVLFGRLSAQHAGKNLDSSEDFGLGGANGVRAYPSGEGFGDSGWLAQVELRYAAGAWMPYAFYDAGRVKINANPWSAGVNQRSLAGAGLGLRYQHDNWSLDAALAWRTRGGVPQSDIRDRRAGGPQAWLNLAYRF